MFCHTARSPECRNAFLYITKLTSMLMRMYSVIASTFSFFGFMASVSSSMRYKMNEMERTKLNGCNIGSRNDRAMNLPVWVSMFSRQ